MVNYRYATKVMNTPKPFFFFVGKPASGKETQAKRLAESLNYPVFMSGAKFRELMESGTYLGNRVREEYETGHLLPAWIADYLFEEFVLNLSVDTGAVFEGSSRDLNQVKTIDEVARWLKRPYMAFHLKVSDDTVIARSLARSRDAVDTDEEKLRIRLNDYARLTDPAIDRLRELGKCVDIDGEQSLEDIKSQVWEHAQKQLN